MAGSDQVTEQFTVTAQATINPSQVLRKVALFSPSGAVLVTVLQAAAQADTVAADLAALKVDFNLLLAKLRTAGVIASS